MNGGQDPPNSRDELNPLENNSSTEAHESSSENISSLLAPLLSESMRSDPDHAPNEDGTFEESDFDSLKHDSEMISPQDCRSMSETSVFCIIQYDFLRYRSDSPHIFSEDVDFPGLKSMENESMLPRDDPSSLKKKKSKSKSPSKSESTDWRMVGRSRERSTSMRKKAEHSISPSDTSHLSMSTDQRSSSTRREMRGLMKAIDTASATASPHLDVNQEKKELKSSDKQQSVIKSPPRKSSSLESTSSRRSEIVDSPRRSTEEGVQEIHPVQSRQASAENSFIQRVRRFVLIETYWFPYFSS